LLKVDAPDCEKNKLTPYKVGRMETNCESKRLFTLTAEQMIKYSARNPFGRFPDGRPKVPDEILQKLGSLSAEDVWKVLYEAGYHNQYDGDWMILNPRRKLVGRAVTAQFMPLRPDLNEALERDADANGLRQNANQQVIDLLQKGDVVVVDLFAKRAGGTFVGDILATAIYAATKTGIVVDGAVRDLEGICQIDMAAYVRAVHPTPLHQVMLTGINVPIRIGATTVMPGDVVFGDREGVYFIPPELAGKVVESAQEAQAQDEWTKEKLLTGRYKSSDVYPVPQSVELSEEYQDYKRARTASRFAHKPIDRGD
jgi:4-hydroxy-4-methyl-2-oxoglutarate aldolase